ncbi:MAG: hypothetical protein R3179_10780 [Sedimenticolaceae bacterium]|nr:hypothetical protein [Sedimenticolaceae bacterium]
MSAQSIPLSGSIRILVKQGVFQSFFFNFDMILINIPEESVGDYFSQK